MTELVDSLVARFRSDVSAGQESALKIDVLAELVEIDDPQVVDFLTEVAGNAQEYDLARIEALKALEVRKIEPNMQEAVVRMLRSVIERDSDDDVRSFAARALAGFTEVLGVLKFASDLIVDPEEDEDVRHNAFFAIERSKPTADAISAMERVRDLPQFRAGAARVLERWKSRVDKPEDKPG